jgi:hypothetical protein
MPQISGDERVEVNNKTCKKELQVAKKKTARAQHSLTSSAGKSTGSARDTIPRQKDKRKQRRRRARRRKLPVDTG